MTDQQEIFTLLESHGYTDLKVLPGRGVVGLSKLIFTTGIVYGLDEFGYRGRYCYHTMAEAEQALRDWDGNGDPPGNWAKHKGDRKDRENPNYKAN
jgi:hypothetical protein